MGNFKRLEPTEAAEQFILKYYPNSQGALLAGSVVRGEATDTSDLDIVIFDETINSAYRESLIEFGWPLEVFVHNLISYKYFFEEDKKRARPSLPRMISEGTVIKDKGILDSIKKEANQLLDKGPENWSEETIKIKQYVITDSLDDFIGCEDRAEELFIANTLAELIHEFVLRTNGHWIGSSKWIIRALKQYDKGFADNFVQAFDIFYKTGQKSNIVRLVDKVLMPYGGRLFDGYSLGKAQDK